MQAERRHEYATTVTWSRSEGSSTKTYAGYSREHTIGFANKEIVLRTSADRAFRGNPALVNPEELLLAALSSCHLLSYLAYCSLAGIEIVSYLDCAHGVMSETGGAGRFVSVTLEPQVVVTRFEDLERAAALHREAHEACFIANSMNFPVVHHPVTTALGEAVR